MIGPSASDALRLPRGAGLPEQPLRSESGAFAQARELSPHHVLGDAAPAGGSIEAAIGAGEHARRIADNLRDSLETVRHHLRMLDEIGQAVDHAGDQELVVPQWMFLKTAEFVGVARIGERQYEAPDIRPLQGWE